MSMVVLRSVRLIWRAALLSLVFGVGLIAGQLSDTFTNWLQHPAIQYGTRPVSDPVAELNRKLQDGTVHLTFDGPSGYLRSVLNALDVPVESQIAVFVKDSVQAARISPGNPRTIFFNDSVAVGWVRGGFIELAAQDPQQGVVFYSLDQNLFARAQTLVGPVHFTPRSECVTCHFNYSTVGVPGMLARSVGQFAVDDRTPIEQRWGGWYVTGSSSIRHLGNADPARIFDSPPPSDTLNWSSFDGKFDWTGYLAPSSDISAHMVFEHQMHMMNLLTRIGWEARVAAYRTRSSGPTVHGRSEDAAEVTVPLQKAAKETVDYLMFVDEAPLADRIVGSVPFTEKFEARGPRDRKGRTLRQLDLHQRLMRYPCSYMIYAPQFDALPREAKEAIYQRMWQILSGREQDPMYRRLTVDDRRAIVEILRDTKKDLPGYFK
jgi:hypothetical protein